MSVTLTVQAAQPAIVLGNARTVALLDAEATLTWLAFPTPEAPSVFDGAQRATFALKPEGLTTVSREYLSGTPVLRSQVTTATGTAAVIDFLPLRGAAMGEALDPRWPTNRVLRIIEGLTGEVTFRYRIAPLPGGVRPGLEQDPNGLLFVGHDAALVLQTAGEIHLNDAEGAIEGMITVSASQRHPIMLTWYNNVDPDVPEVPATVPDWELDGTFDFWLSWGRRCPFQGAQREAIVRLLALVKAWLPDHRVPPDGLPPYLQGAWLPLGRVALAAWGFETELSDFMATWHPNPTNGADREVLGWLLEAFAVGNDTGLLDSFAWHGHWEKLAPVITALANQPPDPTRPAADLAVLAGCRGALALADNLFLAGEVAAWDAGAAAAAARLAEPTVAAFGVPATWRAAFGLAVPDRTLETGDPRPEATAPGPDGPASLQDDTTPLTDVAAAYWSIRSELNGGAYLQARRRMDLFLRDYDPLHGEAPDLGALGALLWLAAQLYLQPPPTPGRVAMPGDLGD